MTQKEEVEIGFLTFLECPVDLNVADVLTRTSMRPGFTISVSSQPSAKGESKKRTTKSNCTYLYYDNLFNIFPLIIRLFI